jgi:hypothetical protein
MYKYLGCLFWKKDILTKNCVETPKKKKILCSHIVQVSVIDLIPKENKKTNLSKIFCESNW